MKTYKETIEKTCLKISYDEDAELPVNEDNLEDYLFRIVNRVVDYFEIDRKQTADNENISHLVMSELLNYKQ